MCFSPKNLNKTGFDAGAQVVISSSHKGVMILSERGLEVQGLEASKGWSQRYPNFWYCQKRGDGEDAWRLINQLDEILYLWMDNPIKRKSPPPMQSFQKSW